MTEIPPEPAPDAIPEGSARLQWDLEPTDVIPAVNQFILQRGLPVGDSLAEPAVYIAFGHTVPPTVLGTPEDRLAQAKAIAATGVWPVKSYGRFFMTRARAVEFRDLLTNFLDTWDEGGEKS